MYRQLHAAPNRTEAPPAVVAKPRLQTRMDAPLMHHNYIPFARKLRCTTHARGRWVFSIQFGAVFYPIPYLKCITNVLQCITMYLILYSIQCPGKYCIQMYLMCILNVFRTVRPVRLDPHSEYCIQICI